MSGISRTLPAPASGGGVAPPATPTTAPPAAVDQQEDEDDELTGEDKKRLERTIDLYWMNQPQDFERKYLGRGRYTRKVVSRMPVVLRNLAPSSAFNPVDAWEEEKARRTEAASAKAAEEAEAKLAAKKSGGGKGKKAGGGGGGKSKGKKLSKADEIRARNKQDLAGADLDKDMERLNNAAKTAKKGNLSAVIAVNPLTDIGKLRKLLMILGGSVAIEHKAEAYDVLWAIEKIPLFERAEKETLAAKSERDAEKAKKSSKKEKEKASKKSTPLSPEAALVYDHRKDLKKVRSWRDNEDGGIVPFQLEQMNDRLPPLSKYNRVFKLDEWQCRVLELVDMNKSAVVCAPTSSGKTVLSTYTVVKIAVGESPAGGVLFVVPSEPLVWQVAAMFEKLMQGQVSFATDLLSYRPTAEHGQSKIIVGTPTALESALSKVRGKVGAEVTKGHDYMQMQGGFDFSYAVFDEVHSLDGEEGDALQRLMHLVECPFLALSATIGNAEELRTFWSDLRSTHSDCIPELVQAGDETHDPQVNLTRHEGRFINLQRMYMTPRSVSAAPVELDENGKNFTRVSDVAKTVELRALHPCAALTIELLKKKSFKEMSISFTPRDSLALWKAFKKHVTDQSSLVSTDGNSLEPNDFFNQYGGDIHQITLEEAKEYEIALKGRMESMARDSLHADQVQAILEDFKVDETTLSFGDMQLYEFAIKCKEEDLSPCLCFQLDSFRCLALFKELLGTLEARQRQEFPNHYKDLEAKAAEEALKADKMKKAEESGKKAGRRRDDDDDVGGPGDDGMEDAMQTYIDTAAPHDAYVLSRPNVRISALEFEDIQKEMKSDKEDLPPNHPLMRGLRRGIGIYLNDFSAAGYRRIVQRLAQQGKLAMVFSDDSLAYGVNMPFRTCAFCGDMGGLLTPLMAQQMSGRTGRRGLDTQGNIAYLGMPMDAINSLILGQVPDITGVAPLYPTVALQPVLSEFVNTRMARNVANITLKDFRVANASAEISLSAEIAKGGKFFDISQQLLQELGMLDDDNKPLVAVTALTTCWEMRNCISESLAMIYMLPYFKRDFKSWCKEISKNKIEVWELHAAKVELQIEFFARLLHVIDRRTPYKGVEGLSEIPLHASSYMSKYRERQESWDEWEKLIQASQSRFTTNISAPLHENLVQTGAIDAVMLPSLPDGLDGTVFETIKTGRLRLDLPSVIKHDLKRRLMYIGNVLMKMHNCLCQPGEYECMEAILRKCFTRVKYIISDATKNETKLEEDPALEPESFSASTT